MLCEPGSELPLGGSRTRRANTTNGMGKNKEKNTWVRVAQAFPTLKKNPKLFLGKKKKQFVPQ